jgi:hypothetical protein
MGEGAGSGEGAPTPARGDGVPLLLRQPLWVEVMLAVLLGVGVCDAEPVLEGVGDAVGDEVAVPLGDGEAVPLGEADILGEREGEPEVEADCVPAAEAEGEPVVEADCLPDAEAEGDPETRMLPLSVLLVEAEPVARVLSTNWEESLEGRAGLAQSGKRPSGEDTQA